MAKSHSRKQGRRMKELLRAKLLLNLKRKGERLIPDAVLRKLAAAGLPSDKDAYELKLRELDA
jgi:hypothetical protein